MTLLVHCTNAILWHLSGCIYLSDRARTNRYCNYFLATSISLLNVRSGRGSDREEWGLQLLLLLHCSVKKRISLCCVNVNVYHVNLPFGSLKVVLYCTILHCFVLHCVYIIIVFIYLIYLFLIIVTFWHIQ